MIGDVLLISDRHRRAAQQLVERLRSVAAEKLVLAIAGESGTGKSEVAHELAQGLKDEGRLAKILSLDNYYRTLPTDRTRWRRQQGLEAVGEQEIDWPLINQHVDAFRESAEATLPFIDLYTDRVDRLTTSFEGIRVVIIEGVFALKSPADIKVLIDLTYKDTVRVRALRGKELQDAFRDQVLEREHEVVQSHRSLAQLLITRDFEVVDAS